MRLTLTPLIRMTVFLAIGASALAIAGGRHAPPARPTTTSIAGLNTNNYHYKCINGFHFSVRDRTPRFLDPDTGELRGVGMAWPDWIEQASCSPAHGRPGETQVVGRWVRQRDEGADVVVEECGLARFAFPSGKPLNRISSEIVPNSPPCWDPAGSGRILFSAGDGQLYQYAFEEESTAARDDERPARPQPLTWRGKTPGCGLVYLSDPVWPADPRLAGKLIVSLSLSEKVGDGRTRRLTKLWWLQLSPDGTEIETAGPLTPTGGDSPAIQEVCPSLATGPDGRLVMAYLAHPAGVSRFQLWVAPVEIDGEGGIPTIGVSSGRQLAEDCFRSAPAFSADGGWVSCMLHQWRPEIHPARFSVGDVLASPRSEETPRCGAQHYAHSRHSARAS